MNEDWLTWAAWIWAAVGIITFPFLFRQVAPFGRHTKSGWGPMIPNRTGWILMESPSVWWFPWVLFLFPVPVPVPVPVPEFSFVLIPAALWMIHYVHRVLIFPFRIRTKGKVMPLSVAFMAFFFQLVNGFLNGYWLGTHADDYHSDWIKSPEFILGISVFAIGMGINLWADEKLLKLRKPGETGYKIPKGGLYEWISCPNFFGEVVEWIGFAILCWNPAGWAFAIWTAANLIPRAWAHHRWYLEKFPDYPRNRKAVIPFLF